MLKKLLNNTKFKSEIKKFFDSRKDVILDIILFGSLIKGKDEPKDVDILILFKDKKDFSVSYELKKKIKEYNVEVVNKTYSELFEGSFKAKESILSEGYSLVYNKFLSEGFGYSNLILFKYELKKFNKSDRMRFYYSLYGRNKNEGMLVKLELKKFSDTILLCPIKNEYTMQTYLDVWKINYVKFPILIPGRLKIL